jgi:hypothetical protein
LPFGCASEYRDRDWPAGVEGSFSAGQVNLISKPHVSECWICGALAGSGEHIIKRSDMKSVFGIVNQNNPIYFHDGRRRNKIVQRIDFRALKYSKVICSKCNNERTQSHDKTWERLSEYFRCRTPPVKNGTLIRLSDVFPGAVRLSMLEVYLYFLKLFGCLIAENNIPLNLAEFSRALMQGIFHPNVYLAFWVSHKKTSHSQVGRTHVEAITINNSYVVYATWCYVLEHITVNIIYSEPTEFRKGLSHAWHPSNVGKRVRVVSFEAK